MDLGGNISDSIKYPFSDFKNLVIFIVVIISNLLIVTIPLTMGYLYRIIKETSEGNDVMPDFSDLGGMFIDGLKLIVVYLAYIIISIIIYGIFVLIGGAIGSAIGSDSASVLATLFGLIGLIPVLIILVIALVGEIKLVLEDSIGAAFDFSGILDMIKEVGIGDFIIWYIVITIIYSIITGIGGLLSITIICPVITYAISLVFINRSTALLFTYE